MEKSGNDQYITHKINLKQLFQPSFTTRIILSNGGSVCSNYNIDMTITNTSMFGVMFEVGLLIAYFKMATFVNKPLFIHSSEKL